MNLLGSVSGSRGATEKWLTVFTEFFHDDEKRAALVKILSAYRFDKDREKS